MEARVRFEEAARDRPDDVPLLLDLARVTHKAGDGRGALGYLAHARALEPEERARALPLRPDLRGAGPRGGGLQLPPGSGAPRPGERRRQLRHGRGRPPPQGRLRGHPLLPQVRGAPARTSPAGRSRSASPPSRPRTTRPPARCSSRRRSGPRPRPPPTTSSPGWPARRTSSRRRLRFALRSVEANPSYADPWSELGLLYLRLGQPEKAEEALERCLKLDPEHYLGNLHLMMLYAQTRDPREPEQRQRFDEIKTRRSREGGGLPPADRGPCPTESPAGRSRRTGPGQAAPATCGRTRRTVRRAPSRACAASERE